MNKEINYDTKIIQSEAFKEEKSRVIIPECCRLGLPSCPHQVKRAKPSKRNIGL